VEFLQKDIIDSLGVKTAIEPESEILKRIQFLKEYVKKTPSKGFVLGISGGQDSTLAGKLIQMAINELKKESGEEYRFIALRLPYGVQMDEDDAQAAIDFIKPDLVFTVDIKPSVDAAVTSFESSSGLQMSDFNKGNQKAQERMTVHYRFANQFNVLVAGTDHAAESLTGFFTKYGDGGADILPLSGLNKRQGRSLLQALGAPDKLYLKKPTADLLDHNPGQTDETELGITYEEIDDYLEGKEIHPSSRDIIESRYLATRHKRELPVSPFDLWWR